MLIGIDGGGTKTDLILLEKDGTLKKRLICGGCSVSELGAQTASERLTAYITELLSDFGGQNAEVDALFAGLSGGGNADSAGLISTVLKNAFPNIASVRTAGDTLSALYAGVGTEDGMVVIAGTGSSCYVRHNGQYSLVGGWGHLIDDAGSGFWLGKEALNAALREEDGRGERTVLTPMVNEKLGKDVRTCIAELYAGGKPMIASFAPLLLKAAGYGDRIAKEILYRAADELALLIRAGARLIDKKPCRVALAGSLWNSELLFWEVSMLLNKDYELLPFDIPPVLGSAVAAAEDAHVTVSPSFRSRLFHALKG
jgi:N-acetylglucosamine kinase-like BadF-type ATPase